MGESPAGHIYQSGPILRIGVPVLASLVAAVTTVGMQAVLPISGLWAQVLAVSGGVAMATLLLLWHHVTRRRLELFEGWFRYVLPGRTLIAHWDDVVGVLSPTSRRRRFLGRHEYVLVMGGGNKVRLGAQVGADAALGTEIETRTRGVIASRTEAHIDSGRRVAFGPITVGADGIEVKTMGTRSIPFDRIRDHRLKGRHYLIRSMDSRRTSALPVSRVPSVGALSDVVERRREQAIRGRLPAGAPR